MRKIALLLALTVIMVTSAIAEVSPKREFRSTWLATVWSLDWPTTKITTTGSTAQIAAQKKEMIRILDSLQVGNMNAVNFQVRSRCDAMYKSSYEPWSSDLVATRGMEPGYDPLAFVVEEAHKRGIEVHAWINPYRYSTSSIDQWDGTPKCYSETNPEWLMNTGAGTTNDVTILNPGLPEVRQRIVDVIKEIIDNYDVDGIQFDDYFYADNSSGYMDLDKALWQSSGSSLSQADWRRENVNKMIADVYSMIQTNKPWITFGVSPAGVAATNSAVAAKYGVDPCPVSSDWQYGGIYSDPLAWISSQTIDYISPQVYWAIGSSADFSQITPWWAKVTHKFGRHFFTSHSISSLINGMKSADMSMAEAVSEDFAKGDQKNASEYVDQIRCNRESSCDNAPGVVFYSTKYYYRTKGFPYYLRQNVFQNHALRPAIYWHKAEDPGMVTNLKRESNTLSWTGYDNVRYTIYAVPDGVEQGNACATAEYLLTVCYDTTYEIPEQYQTGYQFAVAVYDKYAYEYTPMFVGATQGTITAPALTYPANGGEAMLPFDFTWDAVEGAAYRVTVAADADFNDVKYTFDTEENKLSSLKMLDMANDITYYWKVTVIKANCPSVTSAVSSFSAFKYGIKSPADGATAVSVTANVELYNLAGVTNKQLQINTSKVFTATSMALDVAVSGASYQIPVNTLHGGTTYYARLNYDYNGQSFSTDVISFVTEDLVPGAPVILSPANNAEIKTDEFEVQVTPDYKAERFRIQISASNAFPVRTTKSVYADDFNSKVTISKSGQALSYGTQYYVRAHAAYHVADLSTTQYSESSDVITLLFTGSSSVESAIADGLIYATSGDNARLVVQCKAETVKVEVLSATGAVVDVFNNNGGYAEFSLSHLDKGIYLFRINIDGNVSTLKYIK